jgi:hypothetical protein
LGACLGVITLALAYVIIVSYQYRAGAAVVERLVPDLVGTDWPVLIVAFFVIAYTALAGMISVAYTDVANGVLIIIGIAIALPMLISHAGGWRPGIASLPQDLQDPTDHYEALKLINWLLPAFLLILGDANMYQRFFSAKSPWCARASAIWLMLGISVDRGGDHRARRSSGAMLVEQGHINGARQRRAHHRLDLLRGAAALPRGAADGGHHRDRRLDGGQLPPGTGDLARARRLPALLRARCPGRSCRPARPSRRRRAGPGRTLDGIPVRALLRDLALRLHGLRRDDHPRDARSVLLAAGHQEGRASSACWPASSSPSSGRRRLPLGRDDGPDRLRAVDLRGPPRPRATAPDYQHRRRPPGPLREHHRADRRQPSRQGAPSPASARSEGQLGAGAVYEEHRYEQYFWDETTIARLADFAEGFERVCCLCAPMLGKELVRRGGEVRILDRDERFAELPGFRSYDIYRPEHLGERFGLIVCDPPFFNVSLAQLFKAVRMLADFDFAQPLLRCYLTRRESSVLGTFAPFGIEATGERVSYVTVQAEERNEIACYSNVPPRAAGAQ